MSDPLQDQLELGQQAEDFLKYISEHPYFNRLLERISLTYAQAILNLAPEQKDKFTELKTAMGAVSDIPNSIRGDIYLGSEALKKLNGTTEEPKGLL